MKPFRLLLVAGLACGTGSAALAAQEARRDTAEAQEAGLQARPDTVEADSIRRDSARVELEARRQALSGEGFPERDSVFQRLMQLSGFQAVEYRGDRVELEVARELVKLRGDAQANYAASVLEADSISYFADLQFIRARGDIRLSGEGREVRNDSVLFYDISRFKGTIMDARTSFAERGAEWYVRGTATLSGDDTAYVQVGTFTTCELEEPHYWFKAGKIKVVSNNYIVAWPVVFYIHGIPVAWLPFFAQDIRPGRRSGFLPPRFGFNDIVQTGNTARSVSDFGYYLALSPYLDAQFTADWLSGSFTRLNGAFRYRFLKKFLRGNILTSYSFGGAGRNYEIQANHDQQLTPSTDFRLNARFVRNTRLFEDRIFEDPTLQTQTINTDVGLNHRFDFAALNFSARRQQFLGDQEGRTTLELPRLQMSFSPVTLFRAPATRAGPFNNLTWSGNLNFNRQLRLQEADDDQTTTRADYANSLRLGRFNVSGSANLNDIRTVPFDDSLGVEGDPFSQTQINWNSGADYQVDLMGSTVLRPTVQVNGARFKSPDTGGDFLNVPTRLNVGATLSTDLYGFLPGFGPFSRIRHKLSPNFRYTYSPEVEVADSLQQIPGFPGGSARARNTLQVTLNQTFEAKVRPRSRGEAEDAGREREGEVGGEPGVGEPGVEEPPETEAAVGEPEQAPEEGAEGEPAPEEAAPEEGVEGEPAEPEAGADQEAIEEEPPAPTAPGAQPRGAGGRGQARQEERKMVLLGVNSTSLEFDFARENEPALVTDRWRHNITSDLLRGFSFNLSLDLFEGVGEERTFSPILSEISGSLSFNSQAGLAGLFGLGEPGRRPAPPTRRAERGGFNSRYRLSSFEDALDDPFGGGGGPWNLTVDYSRRRVRSDEMGEGSQSLGGSLRLSPSPNWRIQWRTQYNVTDGEFVLNRVSLERDLHRWMAFFGFSKSPNGNFHFQVMVSLKDAPEVRLDWDQQTQTGQ